MTDLISKSQSVHPTGPPEARLFDTWIDPIETGLRERVRDWIEALIEAELNAALGRPRYGRAAGDEPAVGTRGYRHGRRSRTLTGTFGPTEITRLLARQRVTLMTIRMAGWRSATTGSTCPIALTTNCSGSPRPPLWRTSA